MCKQIAMIMYLLIEIFSFRKYQGFNYIQELSNTDITAPRYIIFFTYLFIYFAINIYNFNQVLKIYVLKAYISN